MYTFYVVRLEGRRKYIVYSLESGNKGIGGGFIAKELLAGRILSQVRGSHVTPKIRFAENTHFGTSVNVNVNGQAPLQRSTPNDQNSELKSPLLIITVKLGYLVFMLHETKMKCIVHV